MGVSDRQYPKWRPVSTPTQLRQFRPGESPPSSIMSRVAESPRAGATNVLDMLEHPPPPSALGLCAACCRRKRQRACAARCCMSNIALEPSASCIARVVGFGSGCQSVADRVARSAVRLDRESPSSFRAPGTPKPSPHKLSLLTTVLLCCR